MENRTLAHLVHKKQSYYELDPNAEDVDWMDVRTSAIVDGATIEKFAELVGWGPYKQVYRLRYPDGVVVWYFVTE